MFLRKTKQKRPKILFDHIPKCCGSSLTELFRRAYGEQRVAPPSIGSQALVAKKLFKTYDVVSGHFGGVIFDNWPCDFFSCTMIRNPVDRALSTYFYFQTLPSVGNWRVEAIRGMKLQDFANSRLPLVNEILNNPLSRHFADAVGFTGDYSNERLTWEAALKGFESYDFIGLCEEFEISIRRLFGALSLPATAIDHGNFTLNKNEARVPKEEVPYEIIKTIERRNLFDIELYKAAKQQLVNRKKYTFTIKPSAFQHEQLLSGIKVFFNDGDSDTAVFKSGGTAQLTITFALIQKVGCFWYMIQIRDMSEEILYGVNSNFDSVGIELLPGDHKLAFELGILLDSGRYSVAVTLGTHNDGTFGSGNMTHLATPKPQAFFDVVGNIGNPFLGTVKLPMRQALDSKGREDTRAAQR